MLTPSTVMFSTSYSLPSRRLRIRWLIARLLMPRAPESKVSQLSQGESSRYYSVLLRVDRLVGQLHVDAGGER